MRQARGDGTENCLRLPCGEAGRHHRRGEQVFPRQTARPSPSLSHPLTHPHIHLLSLYLLSEDVFGAGDMASRYEVYIPAVGDS